MCGIIGYVGTRDVVPVLIGGLKKLEYRGYDSAGVAVVNGNGVDVVRAEGKLSNLEAKLAEHALHGTFGMGHTRWATHGKPNENNAHPHRDCTGNVVVIHNGIIENFLPLKQRLKAQGHEFKSETDTEVVAHLIEEYRKDGTSFVEAVKKALKELEGHYALVMIAADEPGTIIAAKQGPPLVIGLGEGENIVASDVAPLLAYTRNIIYLEDGEYAVVDDKKVERLHGRRREGRAPAEEDPLGCRDGREGRLPALHAQGDPRAAARRPRHVHRPHVRGIGRGLLQRPAVHAGRMGAVQARPHRGLRHVLALRAGRQVPARERRHAFRSKSTTARSTAIASRSSTSTRWSSASRSPARPPTRSPACRRRSARARS